MLEKNSAGQLSVGQAASMEGNGQTYFGSGPFFGPLKKGEQIWSLFKEEC